MKKQRILVTGGCGYIGSHTMVELIEAGFEVVSADNGINSSFSILEGIRKITGVTVENIDIDLSHTENAVRHILEHGSFDGIIHFAALKRVEESVQQPIRYYRNNIGSTLTTMMLMEEMNIPHLIFSSSCTVYGMPQSLPVTEKTPMGKAENPYGATKQTGEILYEQFFKQQTGKSGISLRYFNPAGAHPSALIGEASSQTATNLVPVITETAAGIRESMMVYGLDYDTRDGSAIRDFIHVVDLAKAHTLALKYLLNAKNKSPYEVFNLGIGQGVSVKEAIQAFEEVSGVKVNVKTGPRRSGDVPAIYADNSYISSQLQWKPAYTIHDIMSSAWRWEKVRRSIS